MISYSLNMTRGPLWSAVGEMPENCELSVSLLFSQKVDIWQFWVLG